MYDISVVVLTYNPDWNKLQNTLTSILMQTEVSYEIIVCDDGSKVDLSGTIKEFFSAKNFSDFKIVKAETNRGTILNIKAGCDVAQSPYVKLISPGDYLHDETVLKRYCDAFISHGADGVFGEARYYAYDNGYELVNLRAPKFNFYKKSPKPKKIIRYLLVYRDYILGASMAYRREVLADYLNVLHDSGIVYTEDLATTMLAVDGKSFYCIDGYSVWYECDTGISAPNSKMLRLVQNDQKIFYTECLPGYKSSGKIRKTAKMYKRFEKCKSAFSEKLINFFYFPSNFFFRLRLKFKIAFARKKIKGDLSCLYRIIGQGETDADKEV